MIVKKRCNKDGCRELIDRADTYCEEHKGEGDRQYNRYRKEAEPEIYAFYHSAKWKKKRVQALKRDKWLCQDCLEFEDIYNPADVVDHVVELKDDWSKRLELSNLRSLCHEHHNIKTAEEAKKRRNKEY